MGKILAFPAVYSAAAAAAAVAGWLLHAGKPGYQCPAVHVAGLKGTNSLNAQDISVQSVKATAKLL